MQKPPTVLFGSVLVSTMGAATFALSCYAILASELIEEFGVARWQVGGLVTAMSLGGAVIAPSLGSLVDRMGAKRATTATLLVATAGLVGLAVSPVYAAAVGAALLAGVAQASANPATNKLIALHVEPGRRGVITGVKQSGVTLWTFVAGFVLPAVTVAVGWRWAVGVFALAALGFGLLSLLIPDDPDGPDGRSTTALGDVDPFVWRLALYGFILGAAGSAFYSFMPLYAEEALGLERSTAALTASVAALAGVVGRIGWGRIAERSIGSTRALVAIAVLAFGAGMVLLTSSTVVWLLWPAAVAAGLSSTSWNAVGMLAVMENAPPAQTGRASGIVLLGFLAGLGVGAPIFGFSVDRLGSYTPGWVAVSLAFLLAVPPLVGRARHAGP